VAIRIEETKKQVQISSNSPKSSNYANGISKPFFKTKSVPKKHQEAFSQAWSNSSLVNQISAQIKALDLQQKSASCLDKTYVLVGTESFDSEEDDEDQNNSEEESLNVISRLFRFLNVISRLFDENEAPLAVNKIRHWNPSSSRNYYPRPTPMTSNMKRAAVLHQHQSMEPLSIPGILMANPNMKSLVPFRK